VKVHRADHFCSRVEHAGYMHLTCLYHPDAGYMHLTCLYHPGGVDAMA
jgi:hypothetical protein